MKIKRTSHQNIFTFFLTINLSLGCLLYCLSSYALEVDKKLKSRILQVSSSKKTVLINKGENSGLVLKDQAKFSDQNGVFARGEVIKLSPERSAWSLFRVYQKQIIVKEKACLIKISEPYKVTKDQSKSLGKFSNLDKNKVQKKSIIRFFSKVKNQNISTDGVDYTNLEQKFSSPRNSDLDWKNIDGTDDDNIKMDVDYSNLR